MRDTVNNMVVPNTFLDEWIAYGWDNLPFIQYIKSKTPKQIKNSNILIAPALEKVYHQPGSPILFELKFSQCNEVN